MITESAGNPHPAAHTLVYLVAAAPDAGESLADLAPQAQQDEAGAGESEEVEQVAFRPDGTILLTPEAATPGLFNDCDRVAADSALAQLRPMNPEVNSQPVRAAAWRHLPTTYVRCSHDQVPEWVTAAFFDSVEDIVELPTGHRRRWRRPDLVADVLLQRAR